MGRRWELTEGLIEREASADCLWEWIRMRRLLMEEGC